MVSDIYLLQQRLYNSLERRIKSGEIALDLRGHYRQPEPFTSPKTDDHHRYFLDMVLERMSFFGVSFTFEEVALLLNGEKLPKFKTIKTGSRDCGDCGKSLSFETNGRIIRAKSKCLYPNGHPEYFVEINVPSGKLAFANDFRGEFPLEDEDRFDINIVPGKVGLSQAYAEAGMIHLYVGNSCPSVYRNGDKLIVGNEGHSFDTDEILEPLGEETGASICTDLWWFSAADYDELIKRMDPEELKRELEHWAGIKVVEVPPGRYRASSRSHLLDDWEAEKAEVFSVIERIGDCT